MNKFDVIVVGAGAAGLMCALEAGRRGRTVLVLDSANKAGKKILMSGGGRCNFTNLNISPDKYISNNPHFCKSALSRFTQWDFIERVKQHGIAYHEKTLGQLFCDHKSSDILEMLLADCNDAGVAIQLKTTIDTITKTDANTFKIKLAHEQLFCKSLVIASGGLSIPTMGASPFAYKVAEQFNINVWPTRAGLVPLTLDVCEKNRLDVLSGVAVDSLVLNERIQFRENLLFTHRGLSGPVILQISSYWFGGEPLCINLLPDDNAVELLKAAREATPLKQLNSILSNYLPKRVVDIFIPELLADKKASDLSNRDIELTSNCIHNWNVKPSGTEGYRTAEVTLGGVDCNAVSSKTMEVNDVPGLYFIGEALDVTGWLGGYNFQWAWSSGWAAGQAV